jgi:hypothetical protein
VIQRNAIRSWTLLHPDCEIILFGNEAGVAETAAELGLRHVPEIACNEFGTPLVSSLFDTAQRLARHKLIGYINADIILMSDFVGALERIAQLKDRFLMVGQRWDVDLDHLLDFDASWQTRLRDYVFQNGQLHGSTGIDFFVFPKDLWENIPPFAIGRPGWDNWMIYRARESSIPVVDVTQVVMAVHQNHGYGHVPQKTGPKWQGPEADQNVALTNPYIYVFTLDGADWLLTPRKLIPARTPRHWRQRINAWLSFNYPGLRSGLNAVRKWR